MSTLNKAIIIGRLGQDPFKAIEKELERLQVIANICRNENTQPELSSMLGDLDSSLEDMINGGIECQIIENNDTN